MTEDRVGRSFERTPPTEHVTLTCTVATADDGLSWIAVQLDQHKWENITFHVQPIIVPKIGEPHNCEDPDAHDKCYSATVVGTRTFTHEAEPEAT